MAYRLYTKQAINKLKTPYELEMYKRTSQYSRERDKFNIALLKKRMEKYNQNKKIRVGDYIQEKNGNLTRVTYIWGYGKKDTIQTGGSKYGSYYLGDGYVSYSGSLDEGYKYGQLEKTNNYKDGYIWFFDHDYARGDGGVTFNQKFRIWKIK